MFTCEMTNSIVYIDLLLRNVQLNIQTEQNGSLKLDWTFDRDIWQQVQPTTSADLRCYVQIRSVDANDGWRWLPIDDDSWRNTSTKLSITVATIEATRSIKVSRQIETLKLNGILFRFDWH